jgi:hypothetical protein
VKKARAKVFMNLMSTKQASTINHWHKAAISRRWSLGGNELLDLKVETVFYK